MESVSATIVIGRQVIGKITRVAVEFTYLYHYLSVHLQPRYSALSRPLLKRVPVSDWVDPLNLRHRRDGRLTMVVMFGGQAVF